MRQFLFVGADYCFETIGLGEPKICTFATKEDAYNWPLHRDDPLRRHEDDQK
jgi:hypothetical protein